MTPTRLLIGQILIVFEIMVLGVWAPRSSSNGCPTALG